MSGYTNGVGPGFGAQHEPPDAGPDAGPESSDSLREQLDAARRRIAELESQRAVDTVTNLPRRAVMMALIETQIKHRRQFAIVFADVDGLKSCNDRFGHHAGDDLLVRVADVLSANVREADGDFVCRWGGDEFVVLLRNPESPHIAAGRLRSAVSDAVRNLGAGLSVGVASFPEDGSTSAQLVRVADSRMYAAKPSARR